MVPAQSKMTRSKRSRIAISLHSANLHSANLHSAKEIRHHFLTNRETNRCARAAGYHHNAHVARWGIDEHRAIGGSRIGAHPAFADGRRRPARRCGKFAENEFIDMLVRKTILRGRVVMAITNDETAVRALHHDKMNPVLEMLALLRLEPRAQRGSFRQRRITSIPQQAKIRHHGARQAKTRICKAQHLQLAAAHLVPGYALRVERVSIISRTYHHRPGLHHAP